VMVPMLGRIKRWAKSVYSRLTPKVVILLYHRVTYLPSDPQCLAVSPDRFAEHLALIKQIATPMSLSDLLIVLKNGKMPKRSVVLTFDDGYADNFLEAKPLLEKYQVPATMYVASGFVGRDVEFWWDAMERLFLYPGTLPKSLTIKIEGISHLWKLGASACYGEKDFQENSLWNVLLSDNPTPRHKLYREICPLLRELPTDERKRVIAELYQWAGGGPHHRESHRPLKISEVIGLAESSMVDVGAHTITHPVLSTLSFMQQKQEIEQSKHELESMTGRCIETFSYPFGGKDDYNEDSLNIVKEAGFSSTCSNFTGANMNDLHQLPRFLVRDWDVDFLETKLKQWFEA